MHCAWWFLNFQQGCTQYPGARTHCILLMISQQLQSGIRAICKHALKTCSTISLNSCTELIINRTKMALTIWGQAQKSCSSVSFFVRWTPCFLKSFSVSINCKDRREAHERGRDEVSECKRESMRPAMAKRKHSHRVRWRFESPLTTPLKIGIFLHT